MICTCAICRDDGPVTEEELHKVVEKFMSKPRCTVEGMAAQAAVAALCHRDTNYCPMCKEQITISRRCYNKNCDYTGL